VSSHTLCRNPAYPGQAANDSSAVLNKLLTAGPTHICDGGKICSKRMTGVGFFCLTLLAVHTDKTESRIGVECPELTKMGESDVRRGYSLGEDVQGECPTHI